ncbi:hypothetical protein GCM10022261_18610 [Brevibacterium daeguense]|uniref:Uncharacterized protein n=1 Tax=Brevibacterium daeguense TaxID=909936 RepID=A0ABP8EK20_9MICO
MVSGLGEGWCQVGVHLGGGERALEFVAGQEDVHSHTLVGSAGEEAGRRVSKAVTARHFLSRTATARQV